MRMAQEVDELAKQEKGKEAIAIEGFAHALRQLPTILADNGGKNFNYLQVMIHQN